MDQKDGKVDGVEEGERRIKAGDGAPREPHDPVTSVVDLPRHSPPASDQEPSATLGVEVFEVSNFWRVRVPSERVFLAVGAAEDHEAEAVEQTDRNHLPVLEPRTVLHQVPGLQNAMTAPIKRASA